MVLQRVSSTKKLRRWQIGHVWLLWHFRRFVKLENEAMKAKDKGMQTHWWGKRTHIWNKIQEHEQRALTLGLKPEEMRVGEFTQTILKMVNNGKGPKEILEELDQERAKKDKSPPSSSGPIV